MNGLNLDAVNNSMCHAIQAAASIVGVVKISAGNYGGRLGPFKAFLKDALDTQ
jgi:formylmethanofuran--tetrahydromethanopterin N-formyltransferase